MTPRKESYRTIPLDKDQVALVSVRDFERLNQWKWFAQWSRCTKSYYAARTTWDGVHRRRVLMHREILGLNYKDGKLGDHRNLHTLDNRRGNLRVATSSGNNINSHRRRDNTSGCKGVYLNAKNGKWYARISINKKAISLGHFTSKESAIAVRKSAATTHYGEFAREQ